MNSDERQTFPEGEQTVDPPPESVPEKIGRYRILGRIGAGGMGTVYKAEDPQLHRVVALKVPHFESPLHDRAVAVQRFLREARAAASIRHPHVCPIYDVGEQDGRPYVVMAYVEGRSLAEELHGGRRFDDPRRAAALVRQVAEGLTAVHAHDIVHRDLKPGNILIDQAGQAILTDFGLAYSANDGEHLTLEGALVGTPAYMSPEQVGGAGEAIGPRADLYSLGAVFYHMLTGQTPFTGPMLSILAQVRADSPPPPSRIRKDLDPELEAIVRKAMARRPDDRFTDARDLADALDHWLAAKPGADRVRRRRRWALAVLALCAVLLGFAVAYRSGLWRPAQEARNDTSIPDAPPPQAEDEEQRARQSRRVHVGYDVENRGAMVRMEPPFVVGVLADLSGQRTPPLPPLKDRRFVTIDGDNFSDVLETAAPRLVLTVPNRLSGEGLPLKVELSFRELTDFEPAVVAQQIPACKAMLATRQQLSSQPDPSNKEKITDLDRKLCSQICEVLHHPDFQRLEATWFGLLHLAGNNQPSPSLKVRVLNVHKKELMADRDKILWRKAYEECYGILGGQPFGLLVGDFEFDAEAEDVRLLRAFAEVAAQSQTPFVAGASLNLARLSLTPDLAAITAAPEYAAWQSFRSSENARYIGLTVPRVLARLPHQPWGEATPFEAFNELADGQDHNRFLWMNAAWTFAARVSEAYAQYGWPAQIRGELGGGAVESLPVYSFPTDQGEKGSPCSTEIVLSDRRASELSNLGFLPLLQCKDREGTVFFGTNSCYKPKSTVDPNGDAESSARLDVLLCAARFSQCLKVMARDKIGSFMEVKDCERWLNKWINDYVVANPEVVGVETKARKPLQDALVRIREVQGKQGWYELVVLLQPRYQLGAYKTPVSIVTEIPQRITPN
jgi:type VI secretion system protein ImpC